VGLTANYDDRGNAARKWHDAAPHALVDMQVGALRAITIARSLADRLDEPFEFPGQFIGLGYLTNETIADRGPSYAAKRQN
jgi:hypothetical protein